MDDVVRRALDKVEAELADVERRLTDEDWVESAAPELPRSERLRRGTLLKRRDELRGRFTDAEAAPGAASAGVGLPEAGRWVPLALFERGEAGARDQGAGEAVPLPGATGVPLARSAATNGTAASMAQRRATFSRQIAEACLLSRSSWSGADARLLQVLRECGDDAPTLRLLCAALEPLNARLAARLAARLGELGAPVPPLPPSLAPPLVSEPGLNQGDEYPDWRDGLTTLQRQVVRTVRALAPAGGSYISTGSVVDEVQARQAGLPAAAVERALVQLCHPLLRRLPLVDARGLNHRRVPGAVQMEAVRLAPFAAAFLDGQLALPLLLINGAECPGSVIPPHSPREMLDGALALMSFEQPWVARHGALQAIAALTRAGPDYPTGGVLHARGPWSLWSGGQVRLRLRASTQVHADLDHARGRLVIDGLPWPMRPLELVRRLEYLRAAGALEGVTAVRDETTSVRAEVVIELEHVAFAGRVERALLTGRYLEQAFEAAFTVQDGGERRTLALDELLHLFVLRCRDQVRDRLQRELEAHRAEAARAEAVVVALDLLDPVLAVLRDAADDEHAASRLMDFMQPGHRAALQSLPFSPSHDYARGFTALQARHLVAYRRLPSRQRDAAVREWGALLAVSAEREAALGSDAVVVERVRAELLAARTRFGDGRRTRIESWD